MSELTPEQIFNSYKNGAVNRTTALNYLRIFIENSDNGKIRRNAVSIFANIGGQSDEVFEYLEELLISDNYPIVRSTAADIIIQRYVDQGEKALEYVIKHEKSINCLITILESLEEKGTESTRTLIRTIEETLGETFTDFYKNLSASDAIGLEVLTRKIRSHDSFFGDYVPKFKQEGDHIVSIYIEGIDNIGQEIYRLFPYLTQIESLDCYPGDLTGLSNLSTLRIIGDDHYELESIKKIKGLDTLVNLEHLDLSHNSIRKIGNLESLTKLKVLDLSNNYIEEIENLSHFSNLEILKLCRIPISEIKNLEDLINLKELDVSTDEKLGGSISEIKNLDTLTYLKKLNLANRNIVEIKGLDNLKNLEYLNLYGNELIKIKGLDNLVNLHYLNLGNNKLKVLENVEQLTNLRGLSIVKNNISNINILENLKNLEILNLDKDLFINTDILSKLKNLKGLYSYPWYNFNFKSESYINRISILNQKK